MEVQVTSDNHLEFWRNKQHKFFNKLEINADILVIAGDLATMSSIRGAVIQACEKFKHVIMVAGNHEYYNSSFPVVKATMRALEEEFENFHFLCRNVIEIEGQRFVGCTLWFPLTPQAIRLSNRLNDFTQIFGFRDAVQAEHDLDRKFLEREVQEGDVVITHHAPSEQSAESYKGDPMNCFYVFDLENFMSARKPQYWIHGHMHSSSDYMISQTRVICNPGGYRHEPNENYTAKVLNVQTPKYT